MWKKERESCKGHNNDFVLCVAAIACFAADTIRRSWDKIDIKDKMIKTYEKYLAWDESKSQNRYEF